MDNHRIHAIGLPPRGKCISSEPDSLENSVAFDGFEDAVPFYSFENSIPFFGFEDAVPFYSFENSISFFGFEDSVPFRGVENPVAR